ncbi:MAG: acyltransferase [Bacteroidales bacterium]|nr:acyltransferase [Bacteroidales bacterium]
MERASNIKTEKMQIDLNILSRQRKPLMGIAIWLIILFHLYEDTNYEALGLLFGRGDIGVEIFGFLSGFGCWSSLNNNNSYITFYKKRARRILPSFLIIAVSIGLFRHFMYGASWVQVALVSSGLFLFWGDVSLWFAPYICICYLLSPLLFEIKKITKNSFVLTLLGCVFATLLYSSCKGHIPNCGMWILRLPIFCLGFDLGDYVLSKNNLCKEAKTKNGLLFYLIGLIAIVAILAFIFTIKGWPAQRCSIFFVLCIPLMLVFAHIFEILPGFSRFFRTFSAMTFEIYLANHICRSIPHNICPNDMIWAILVIVSSISLGALVWWISQKILSWSSHLTGQRS